MGKTKAKANPRAAFKKAQAERREAILERWERRAVVRSYAGFFESCRGETWDNVIQRLLPVAGLGSDAAHLALKSSGIDEENLYWLAALLLRAIHLKEMPYEDYLLTDEWKARAERTKARWNWECALNERHTAVDAHHRTYVRRGRELADDIIPLCRECHSTFHGRR